MPHLNKHWDAIGSTHDIVNGAVMTGQPLNELEEDGWHPDEIYEAVLDWCDLGDLQEEARARTEHRTRHVLSRVSPEGFSPLAVTRGRAQGCANLDQPETGPTRKGGGTRT